MFFVCLQCCTFSELLTSDVSTLTKAVKDLEINMDALLYELALYHDQTEMNRNFYM